MCAGHVRLHLAGAGGGIEVQHGQSRCLISVIFVWETSGLLHGQGVPQFGAKRSLAWQLAPQCLPVPVPLLPSAVPTEAGIIAPPALCRSWRLRT